MQPLDYFFWHAAEGKGMKQELKKNLGSEKSAPHLRCSALSEASRRPKEYRTRLLRNLSFPKSTVDKARARWERAGLRNRGSEVTGSMKKRVAALHKRKGGLTAYDMRGKTKDEFKDLR